MFVFCFSQTITLGEIDVLPLHFKVTNEGESAFNCKLNITFPKSISIRKKPSKCNFENLIMTCDLDKCRVEPVSSL